MNRRVFLQQSALGGAALALGATVPGCSTASNGKHNVAAPRVRAFDLEETTLVELQAGVASGRFSAEGLARAYLRRIDEVDRHGPQLKSVIELNPDALATAAELDKERKAKGPRGPLHGIPVLIKDNIDTHDRMTTTAGSLALEGSIAPQDAFVVARLRAAGVVLLGKTNLSEWANFRSNRSISGWSGRGGQTRNPYVTDRSPSGSSSGSAAAVSANLCAVAIGTETDGSIVSPASFCGVVGIKPTVGLVSRSGIIPISASQDTAGPMARTVADATALLGVMMGRDPQDSAKAASAANAHSDYTPFLDANALHSARIGVARSLFKVRPSVDPVWETALEILRREGAELIDPVTLPPRSDLGDGEHQTMLYEFKTGLNDYLALLGPSAPVRTLAEVIAFNERECDREMPFFGQEIFDEAEAKGPLTEKGYLDARARCAKWRQGLDKLFDEHRLDAIVAPTGGPAHTLDWVTGDRWLGGSSSHAAVAGFPNITVPCGDVFGLPLGLSFFGRAWTEPRLIALAYAFEQATKARRPPRFLWTLDLAGNDSGNALICG